MVRLELFGHPRVSGKEEKEIPFTKPALLLIYLASRGDWVSRDELALFFRPDADEKTARHNLRLLLTRARKFDWAEGLEQEGKRLRFQPETDLTDFRRALGKAQWQSAVAFYKDGFLATLPSPDLPTLETWLEVERASLQTAWQDAALKAAEDLTATKNYTRAANLLAKILEKDKLAEDVLQAYLRSSYLAGDAGQALQAYKRFKEQLKLELDLEPLAETLSLVETVERADTLTEEPQVSKADVPLTVLRPPVMIGRKTEKEQAANAALCIVSGEGGVGKSRFVAELAPKALWVRCQEGLSQVAYFPLIALLKDLDLPDLGAYQGDLARLLPELGTASPPSDADTVQTRLFEAIARALESQNKAIVFDDLQWADSATLAFFAFMAQRQTKAYATVRTGELSDELSTLLQSLTSLKGYTHIQLEPLQRSAISQLIKSLSPETAEAEAFSNWLKDKTGGNPFFLLETLRALFEAQVLQDAKEGWYSTLDTVTKGYAHLAIPAGVTALVERRVRGLSNEAQRVLDVATVLAEGITAELSAKLAGLSLWAASDALTHLEERGLIQAERFGHDLARQALYESLPETKRRFLHKQIASALPESVDELVRAEHYFQASDKEQAVKLWGQAIKRLDALGREEETISLSKRIIELNLDMEEHYVASVALADWERVQGYIEAAEKRLKEVIKTSRFIEPLTNALVFQALIHCLYHEFDDAEALLDQVSLNLERIDDANTQMNYSYMRAHLYKETGRFAKGAGLMEDLINILRRDKPNSFVLADMLGALGSQYSASGQLEKALACHEECLAMARELGSSYEIVQAISNIGVVQVYLKTPEKVLNLLLEGLSYGEYDRTKYLHFALGAAYANLGQYQEAEQYANLFLNSNLQPNNPEATAILAQVYEATEQADELKQVQEALLEYMTTEKQNHHMRVYAFLTLNRYGTASQRKEARALLRGIDRSVLRRHLEVQLREALAEA